MILVIAGSTICASKPFCPSTHGRSTRCVRPGSAQRRRRTAGDPTHSWQIGSTTQDSADSDRTGISTTSWRKWMMKNLKGSVTTTRTLLTDGRLIVHRGRWPPVHTRRLSMKFTIQVLIESPDALPLSVPIQTLERSCERVEDVGLRLEEE